MKEDLVTIARFGQGWKAAEAYDALRAEGIESFSPERMGEDMASGIWGDGVGE